MPKVISIFKGKAKDWPSYFKKKFGVKDITCGMKGLDLSLIVHKKIKIIDTNLGLSIFNYVLRNNKSFSQCMVSGKKRIDQPRYGTAFISNLKIIFTRFYPLKSVILFF